MKLIHGMALGALLLALGFGWGYLWPRPERPAVIIEAREEELPAGVLQLYPRDPAWIVRFFDGAGVWREVRMTAAGYAALMAWVKGNGP